MPQPIVDTSPKTWDEMMETAKIVIGHALRRICMNPACINEERGRVTEFAKDGSRNSNGSFIVVIHGDGNSGFLKQALILGSFHHFCQWNHSDVLIA